MGDISKDMKKIYKRLFSILLMLFFMLSAFSCSSSSPTEQGNVNESIFKVSTKLGLLEEEEIKCTEGIPFDLVDFKVLDNSIIEIEGSKIVAKKVGTTQLTATIANLQQTTSIEVIANATKPTIDLADFGIILQDTITLNPLIVFKGKEVKGITVSLKSSNTEVVAVDGLKVTGVAKGEVDLTIQGKYQGEIIVEKTVNVNVHSNMGIYTSQYVYDLTVVSTLRDIEFKNSLPLETKVYKDGEIQNNANVVWESENPSIATVVDGVVKGEGIGNTNIVGTYTVDNETITKTVPINVGYAVIEMQDDVILDKKLEYTSLQAEQLFGQSCTIEKLVDEDNFKTYTATENKVKTNEIEDSGEYRATIYAEDIEAICKVNLHVADYVVYDKEDLRVLADNVGDYVVVANDIDYNDEYNHNKNDSSFNGVFNGLGHTLDGIIMRWSGGLYQWASGATFKNLAMTNLVLRDPSTAAFAYSSTLLTVENVFIEITNIRARICGGLVARPWKETGRIYLNNTIILAEKMSEFEENFSSGAIAGRIQATIVPINSFVVTDGYLCGRDSTEDYNTNFEVNNRLPIVYKDIETFNYDKENGLIDMSGYGAHWDFSGEYPKFKK